MDRNKHTGRFGDMEEAEEFFRELAARARKLHSALGEREFWKAYKSNPYGLLHSLLVSREELSRRFPRGSVYNLGRDLLQIFPSGTLLRRNSNVHQKILEDIGRRPLHTDALAGRKGAFAVNRALQVLEERGLVRLERRGGLLVVAGALVNGEWKAGVQPQGELAQKRGGQRYGYSIQQLLEDLKAGRISKEEYLDALAKASGHASREEHQLAIARKHGYNSWEEYQGALGKGHGKAVEEKLKALKRVRSEKGFFKKG
jgi:DNA-binding transcriptional regulator YhcF (GntR family)